MGVVPELMGLWSGFTESAERRLNPEPGPVRQRRRSFGWHGRTGPHEPSLPRRGRNQKCFMRTQSKQRGVKFQGSAECAKGAGKRMCLKPEQKERKSLNGPHCLKKLDAVCISVMIVKVREKLKGNN